MIDDGGPAYPFVGNQGMTLRDYFAGQAMTGLLAAEQPGGFSYVKDATRTRAEYAAKEAYEMADAMIDERSKEK